MYAVRVRTQCPYYHNISALTHYTCTAKGNDAMRQFYLVELKPRDLLQVEVHYCLLTPCAAVLHVSPAQRNCPLLYDRVEGTQNPSFSHPRVLPNLAYSQRTNEDSTTPTPACNLYNCSRTTSARNTPGRRPRTSLYNRTHRTYRYDVGDDNLTLSISHSHSHNVTVVSTANDKKPLRVSRTRSTRRECKRAGGEKKDRCNGALPFTLAH